MSFGASITGPRSSRLRVISIVVTICAIALGSFVTGRATAGNDLPREGSAEVGFARDMASHHAQAVAMAEVVRNDSAVPPDVRTLATDIVLTQQAQIGQMQGWLASWGVKQAGSPPAMAWAGHSGPMPGMATPEAIGNLKTLPVSQLEPEFLKLMIPHHEGGVEMAKMALDRTQRPEVRRLAQAIVDSQTAELDAMRKMLDAYDPVGVPQTPHGSAH